MTEEKLVFLAGDRALEAIRSKGLSPEDISVVAGAAGGPKWLILSRLDRLIFGGWLRERRRPLYLLGSSIGSWRFAAASCRHPVAALERLEYAYIRQAYAHKPSAREVSAKSLDIIEAFLGPSGSDEVLAHPFHRLNLLAGRSRQLLARDERPALMLGLAFAVMSNLFSRKALRLYFQQTLFTDPRERPPFDTLGRHPNARCPLSPDNLKTALLASGSIPYVMAGVSAIAGAPPGVYRDGGAVDYHLDVPFGLQGKGTVLFPHFSRRIIPGWFDKGLSWRRPSADNLADVLVIAPSESFVSGLPDQKIPDRRDFYRYAGDDPARFACWRQVADAGRALADDFIEAVLSGAIRSRVTPLPTHSR